MAIKPTKPTVPAAPSRLNPGAEFATRADTFAAFQSPFADYLDATADFVDGRADEALAAAVGADLPPITNKAGQYVRVNNAGTAVEFAPSSDPENLIINGAFDFWQRGTSSTSLGYVAADRWANGAMGGTVTQARVETVVGQPFGRNTPRFFLRQTVSGQTLTTHLATTDQRIEGVRSYSGQTITVLGWARRSSGAGNMAVEAVQDFGTGGSPSASVFAISPTIVPLTSSWAPFAVVMNIPSITGRTVGTNGNDYLSINFWTSAGSNFNARTNSLGLQTIGVDLWGIHIKIGAQTASATDVYLEPEIGPETARCQRYYFRSAIVSLLGVATASTQECARSTFVFPQTMRATPTVSWTGGTAINLTTGDAVNPSAETVGLRVVATVAGQAGRADATLTADAEL